MGGGHFWIERDGAGKFSLRFVPALESCECVTELEMCVSFFGAFGNVFLKRFERSRKIISVDRLLGLLEQQRERIFLGLGTGVGCGSWRRWGGGLRVEGGCGPADHREKHCGRKTTRYGVGRATHH